MPESGVFDGSFSSWGKHVVLGKFTVPNTGTVFTDVYLGFDIGSANNASALFKIMTEDEWNPALFLPDGYTPWGGVSSDRVMEYLFTPGETIYFAFGIESGVGAGGHFSSDFNNSDDVTATLQLLSNTPVPIPSAIWLFGSGLLGLFGVIRKKAV